MEYGKQKTLAGEVKKQGTKFVHEVSEEIMEAPRKDFKKQVVTGIIMAGLFALSKMSHFIVITFLTALTIHPLLASAFVFALALLLIGIGALVFRKRIMAWRNDLSGELTRYLDKAFQKELSSKEGKALYQQISYGSKVHKKAVARLSEEFTAVLEMHSERVGVDLKNVVNGYAESADSYQASLKRAEAVLMVLMQDYSDSSLTEMLTQEDKLEIMSLMKKHIANVKEGKEIELNEKLLIEVLSGDEVVLSEIEDGQKLFLEDMELFSSKHSVKELINLVKVSLNQLRMHKVLEQGKISEVLQSTETIPLKDVDRANQLINILSSNFESKGPTMPRLRALGRFFYGKSSLNDDQIETLYVLLNKASGGLVRMAMSEESRHLKESGDAKKAMKSALNNFEFDGLSLPTMINFIQCFDELSEHLEVAVPNRAVSADSIHHHEGDDIVPANIQRESNRPVYEDDEQDGEQDLPKL